jgi:hypothetical protein
MSDASEQSGGTAVKMLGPYLILALFALPAAAIAADPAPTPTLRIALGETVTVRISESPVGFVELSRTRGEAHGERDTDTVRFTFSNMGGMTMLQAVNGYARAFDYRARMFAGGRSATTSICTVMPRFAGFESWPDRIERLELSAPRLSERAYMSCQ